MKKYTKLPTKLPCPACKKNFFDEVHNPTCLPQGDYEGNGGELGYHIADEVYGCKGGKRTFYKHPFYYSIMLDDGTPDSTITDSEYRSGIEAHHLICSASVKKEKDFMNKIIMFAYSINHHKNGVLLPRVMKVACLHRVPLHRGSHNAAYIMEDKSFDKKKVLDFPIYNEEQLLVDMTYAQKIDQLVAKIMGEIDDKKACKPEERKKEAEKLINEMDAESERIFKRIKRFQWSISSDGFDYHSAGIGCFASDRIPDKRDKVKNALNIDADDVQTFAKELYTTKLDALKSLEGCTLEHVENRFTDWPQFKEREATYLQEKNFP